MRGKNGVSHHVRRWLVAAALACLSLSAAARQTDRTAELLWTQTGNAAKGSMGKAATPQPLTFSSAGSAGANMHGKKTLPWPGKAEAQNMANWKLLASPSNMAKAVMRPAAFVPLVFGSGLYMLLELACVRIAGGAMQLSDGAAWEECVYTDTETLQYAASVMPPRTTEPVWFSSREDTCNWVKGRYTNSCNIDWGGNCPASYSGTVVGVIAGNPTSGSCKVTSTTQSGTFEVYNNPFQTRTAVVQTKGWREASEASAEAAVQAQMAEGCASANGCGAYLEELIDGGAKVETADSPEVSGPATTQGAPKITTKTETMPDGTTRTVTTTTTTTYNLQYTGDTVTYNLTTNTTTSYSDGTPTKTETETEEDTRTTCEKDPDAFGCKDLDVPDGEVPKTTKDVAFTPTDFGWGGGSCPASPTWTDRLGTHTLNLTDICSAISNWVRPLVLAMAALMALAIAVPRSEG